MMLVAVPQLLDPQFKRSVILLLHHDREGAFGLVVNDPMNLTLEDFSQSQRLPCHSNILARSVFSGGPVEPYRGWILHQNPQLSEREEICEGLYVSGTQDALQEILQDGKNQFLFLLGYSGWGAGQLEKEMKDGSWIASEVDPKYIFFQNPQDTWDAILHDMGVDPTRLALGTGLH